MKLLSVSAMIAVLIIFYSCSKKTDAGINPPAPVVYSTVLSKVFELDTTKTAPSDTVNRWYFTYDNAGRIVSDSFYSTVFYPGSVYYRTGLLAYTGADSFANRRIEKAYVNNTFRSIDTTYYKYVNGLYSSDTGTHNYAFAPSGTSRNNYSYQPGLITRNFQNWIPQWAQTNIEIHRIHQTVSNGGITQQTDTIFSFYNGVPQPVTQTFTTSVSYISNPNPFYKVMDSYSNGYFYSPGIGHQVIGRYAPRNLILQQTSSYGNIVYTYTFRADGYPLIARIASTANGNGPANSKMIFVYQ